MQDDGIELYRRFLDGDERGLEELIALYRHGLFRFIYGYVHDEALAEDLMQEVFIQLYFHRSFKERDDAGFKTYLYKIARNKSLNEIKNASANGKFRSTRSPKRTFRPRQAICLAATRRRVLARTNRRAFKAPRRTRRWRANSARRRYIPQSTV